MRNTIQSLLIIQILLLSSCVLYGEETHPLEISEESTCNLLSATVENFDSLSEFEFLILDIYKENCPACQRFAPVFTEIYAEFGCSYQFAKLNIMQNKSLISQLNIKAVPTVIFYKNGIEVGRKTGYMDQQALTGFIEKAFN